MRRWTTVVLVVGSVLATIILAGCSRGDAVAPEFPTSVAGTRWRAIEWRADDGSGMSAVDGLTGELRFAKGQDVTVSADPGTTWTGIYEDRMAEFEQTFIITDLEAQGTDIPAPASRFIELVGATRSYVRNDDTLTLQDREGDKLMVLERVR